MKILLPTDGSAYSDAAVGEVVERPWPPHSEVKVVTVVELPLMPAMEPWAMDPHYFEDIEKAGRENAKKIIDSALLRLKTTEDQSLKLTSQIVEGSPKQAIIEEAERWGADLIIMGSRGLGTWDRLLLGSISTGVLTHAKCSVEIVRIPSRESHPE